MQWDHALDEEYEEMMDDFEQVLPAIERIVSVDERLDQIEEMHRKLLGCFLLSLPERLKGKIQ